MKLRTHAIAAAVLAISQPPTQAATQITDNITFSGFGTVGFVRADTDQGEYRREFQADGAGKEGSVKVDSNLGLQVTAKATDWLSATVQTLTAQRTTSAMTTRFEWAYVKATPIEDLSVRAGLMSLPNFMVSDSRRVGFANIWLRPANEVYSLDLLNGGLRGVDVSYRVPVAGNSAVITALDGSSDLTNTNRAPTPADKVRGLNILWEGEGYSIRAGQVEASPYVSPRSAALLPPGSDLNETYTFSGLGFTVDHNDWIVQGESVQRRARLFASFINADAWYVMAGHRFGAFVPYVQHAEVHPDSNSIVAPQQTEAVGLRWDAFKSAALKFQIERVDTKGTGGQSFIPNLQTARGVVTQPLTRPVTTLGIALDFVF